VNLPVRGFRLMLLCAALASAACWTQPAFSQRPASTFAEFDAWQGAKNSTDPAVVRAYLEKYPDGEFAAEAREQLRYLGATTPPAAARPAAPIVAPPRTPPAVAPAPLPSRPAAAPAAPAPAPQPASAIPAGASAALVDMTPAAIAEIQTLLFDRGWRIRKVDGRSIDELKATVSRLQVIWKQPTTGDITHGQLAQLRRIIVPTQWSTIAYSPQGASGSALNLPTRAIAEQDAAKACLKRAGSECNIVSVYGKSCLAFSYAVGVLKNVRYHTTTTGTGETIEVAKEASQRECRGLSRTPDGCQVKRVVCADGQSEEPQSAPAKRRR
jgi:hypothetical protein